MKTISGVGELVYDIKLNYLGVRSQESGVRRKERRRKNSRGRKFFVCALNQDKKLYRVSPTPGEEDSPLSCKDRDRRRVLISCSDNQL